MNLICHPTTPSGHHWHWMSASAPAPLRMAVPSLEDLLVGSASRAVVVPGGSPEGLGPAMVLP